MRSTQSKFNQIGDDSNSTGSVIATNFTSINFDCKMLILEACDIYTLLNVAQVNRHFSILAANEFRLRTCSDVFSRTFAIRSPQFNYGMSEIHIAQNFDYIIITNMELAMNILSAFGSIISKLILKCTDMELPDVEQMTASINHNCAQTLIHFEMEDCPREIWNNLKTSFEQVDSVTFSGDVFTGNVTLGKIFPYLQLIKVEDVHIYDRSAFLHHFSHLEHLFIEISETEGFIESDVEIVIAANPQITTLTLKNPSRKLLKFSNEHLRTLQSLGIIGYLDESLPNEVICFESVKEVSMNIGSSSAPNLTVFTNLEEFKFANELNADWIDYIKRNANLSGLHMKNVISDDQIEFFNEGLQNLKTVTFDCAFNVKYETIINFLNANADVNEIRLNIVNDTVRDNLKRQLENEWTIKEKGSDIEFKRKFF